MPEGLEAEIWRRACEPLIGRTIVDVVTDDRVVEEGFADAVAGATFTGTRRRGKVVLLDTDGPTIGLHFGMTGRLVIDGDASIDRLAYASGRDDPAWDRLVLFATPGGHRFWQEAKSFSAGRIAQALDDRLTEGQLPDIRDLFLMPANGDNTTDGEQGGLS